MIAMVTRAMMWLTLAVVVPACAPRVQTTSAPVAAQSLTLTVFVNSGQDVSLVDPLGRVLRFGSALADSQWRNDLGALANYTLGGGRPQIYIREPAIGVWQLGVAVEKDAPVLSIESVTNRGCFADDVIEPVEGGYSYSWDLRLEVSSGADSCRATLKRMKPVSLSR